MILTLRTDASEAEVGLYTKDGIKVSYVTWLAGRQLATDILATIRDQLEAADADWDDLQGVVVYQGPGSFTGLRIGITVANALAYGQSIPIVATQHKSWITTGLDQLTAGRDIRIALPEYGGEAHITMPRS